MVQNITYNILKDDIYIKKRQVYDAFIDYFKNPTMVKKKVDENGLSIYMTKLYCLLLSNKCRYIISIVKNDKFEIGTEKQLSELLWSSFQTRELSKTECENQAHFYEAVLEGILTAKINKISEDHNMSNYEVENLPITLSLLHTEKNPTYVNEGTLINALETFNTVVVMKN